jgi:hypothetical protein
MKARKKKRVENYRKYKTMKKYGKGEIKERW